MHHTKCKCNNPCPKCHAPDTEYPLAQVLQDEELIRASGSPILRRENGISTCHRTDFCQCPCEPCLKNEIGEFKAHNR